MPLVDHSNLDTEATCLGQLGNFANLLTEIRLMIWALFKERMFSPPEFGTNILSILCCSRYLHREISYVAYEDMTHENQIYTPKAARILFVINISSKRLHIETETQTKHVRRHILNFPHHRLRNCRLGLNIAPHYQSDFGQMITIWQSINKFVDALNDIETSPQTPGPYGYKIEHSLSIRPRYRNTTICSPSKDEVGMYVSPGLWAIVARKKHSLSHQTFYELSNIHLENSETLNPAQKKWAYNNTSEIQRWLTDIRIFLDNALDTVQGLSARILRRERFQNWYEDGNKWKSAYEEQFQFDLTNNRDIVMKYDPNLNKARRRHEMLIIWHHLVHAPEDDKEQIDATYLSTKRALYTTWNSKAWFTKKAYGTERIHQGDMAPFCNHSYIYRDYKRRSVCEEQEREI
ncbi:hypothetical protein N7526_001440 [Penicillium atrosanguineum]|nr:hypothetical protein N7526_001440 [Penicillium atrosanguineum]